MNKPLCHTAYEKGTHLYHALRIQGPNKIFQTKLLFAIPLQDDPSEAWLESYPVDKRISKELAAEALEQMAKAEQELTERLRVKRLLEAREKLQSAVDRLTNEIRGHERNYAHDLSNVFGHQPTDADLQDVERLYGEAKASEVAYRLANPNRLAEIMRAKQRAWLESGGESYEQVQPDPPTQPTPTRAERDAKELEEYRGYRALIKRVEGKDQD